MPRTLTRLAAGCACAALLHALAPTLANAQPTAQRAGATTVPTAGEIDALVDRLADRLPAVRDAAAAALARVGRPARAALSVAARSADLRLRRAATAALASVPLTDDADPPALRALLRAYAAAPEVARVDHAGRLAARDEPAAARAAARIVAETPDADVAWAIVGRASRADLARMVVELRAADVAPDAPPLAFAFGIGHGSTGGAADGGDERLAHLRRCLSETAVATAAARPAIRRAADALAADARAAGDAAGELAVRRDAAALAPAVDDAGDLGPFVAAYLEARLRLGDAGVPAEAGDAAAVAEVEALGLDADRGVGRAVAALLAAPPTARPDAPQALPASPALAAATDALAPAGGVALAEALARAGAGDAARAVAARALEADAATGALDAEGADVLRLERRARLLGLVADAAPLGVRDDGARDAAATALARLLADPAGEAGLDALAPEQRASLGVWLRDRAAAARFEAVRWAAEGDDARAVDAALDRLAPLPIVNSTTAIDAIHAFEVRGRHAEADEVYGAVREKLDADLAASPRNAGRLNTLAWFSARTGRDLERAYALARAATARQPNDAAKLDTLAECAFRLGKLDEAVAAETRALADQPDDAFMLRQLDRFRGGPAAGDATRALRSERWE